MKRIITAILLVTFVPCFIQAQSLQELQKIRAQYEQMVREQGALKGQSDIIEGDLSNAPSLADLQIAIDSLAISAADIVNYFGYDFFTGRPNLQIWENMSVPDSYSLGPGDVLIISLWGATELHSEYTIGRGGKVFVRGVGQLYLANKTISQARSYLKGQFERVYSTLRGSKATTFMDVSLGDLKSINVTFIGEVKMPSIHAIHPMSRVTTGLIQAGGIQTSGSLRNIFVFRQDELIATVDMYDFLTKGTTTLDIQLRDQDVVYVPVRNTTIYVEGAIIRPAIYESAAGESIHDVLKFAGNIKPTARETVEINRIVPPSDRISDDDATVSMYNTFEEIKSVPAIDGDHILIREIHVEEKNVYVFGQVKEPGKYPFQESMRVLDALILAGGIHDEGYWKSMYASHAEIIRRLPDADFPLVIPINLKALRDGDQEQNYHLENLDQILVRQNPFFDQPGIVTVVGEVNVPGVYTIQSDDETLADIFNRVKGLTPRAFEKGIRMMRKGQRVILRDFSIPVASGDSIIVPIHPGVVTIRGEIHNPGLVHFRRGMTLKDYIETAGGFTETAAIRSISVTYADGDVKLKKFLRSPELEEGAIITVHRKEEPPPVDLTQLFTQLASIIASLTTIAYVIGTK